MPHPQRDTYATLSPDLLAVFREFADSGEWRSAPLTLREARSAKHQVYNARLRLERERGDDPLAAELYAAAQYMYLEIEQADEAATLIVKIAPLSRRADGSLPWKD